MGKRFVAGHHHDLEVVISWSPFEIERGVFNRCPCILGAPRNVVGLESEQPFRDDVEIVGQREDLADVVVFCPQLVLSIFVEADLKGDFLACLLGGGEFVDDFSQLSLGLSDEPSHTTGSIEKKCELNCGLIVFLSLKLPFGGDGAEHKECKCVSENGFHRCAAHVIGYLVQETALFDSRFQSI